VRRESATGDTVDFVTETDQTNAPGISDLEPGSLAWRIVVAKTAHWFYNPLLPDREEIAKLIEKPYRAGGFRRMERQRLHEVCPEKGLATRRSHGDTADIGGDAARGPADASELISRVFINRVLFGRALDFSESELPSG
jgi:hypothetical protein